ncbi:hypothetical protein [Campylobacter concisus]|uniref:Uncharacterized protein n=1 Tax=Campylobacter concisus ATCC 51562 TaxID=1242969 RepID=U2GF62_9BACT|nr:hypothetical protein [Campylobacter concisus]ERJ26719.1 hypothetical protein ATCC51562_1560 [Campylobacter concisus ATCC 51562]
MNYQDILNEKDENIVRIDRFIEFLKDTFGDLDQYNNEYGQLIALLEKEKRLYFELNKGDFNKILKEVKSVRQQIIFKILVIKNKILNAFKEDKFDDKILKTKISQKYLDKILDSKIDVIKKELVGSEYFAYYLSDLQYKKADEIARIKGFANFLEKTFSNCECKDSRQSKILNLLIKEKKNRIEDIDVNNIKDDIKKEVMELKKEISASLSKESIEDKFKKAKISDEYISNKKEELFNKELFNIKKELLSNKYFEYYLANFYEQKSIKDYLNSILKFYPLILSGISLVSVICYFAYFGIFIGYFPVLSGSDIFYVGALLFFVVAIFTIFFILPIMLYPGHIRYPLRYKNGEYFSLFLLSLSFPLALLTTFIINIAFYIDAKDILFTFMVFLALSYLLSCITIWIKGKILERVFALCMIMWLAYIFILIFLSNFQTNLISILVVNLFFIYITYIFFCLGVLCFCEGIYKDGTHKEISFILMFLCPIVIFFYLADDIAKKFEITNMEYEYLSIEKSALGALPKGICEKTEKDSIRTYYDANDISNVVMLYNIKALQLLVNFII